MPTFEQAARSVHAEHMATWRNAKHAAQWINTLAQYAFPVLGDRRVDHIETPHVLGVLSPIWLTKPETAPRVRQRIGTVLDWAKAAGFCSGENPVAGVAKGLSRQSDRSDHHAVLPYSEIPDFIDALRNSEDTGEPARLAFEFLILTAARTNEVLRSTWGEINLRAKTWTIPRERMKARRQHIVPLSPRCLEIVTRAKELSGNGAYLFPGRSVDKPLSNMVFLMTFGACG